MSENIDYKSDFNQMLISRLEAQDRALSAIEHKIDNVALIQQQSEIKLESRVTTIETQIQTVKNVFVWIIGTAIALLAIYITYYVGIYSAHALVK